MEKQQQSSIRNPNISKTNINEIVNGGEKSSKRVSFSSRNHIKTFVKGSETTQWDLTYEEAINSIQSSQEETNKAPEKNTPKNNSINCIELNQIDEEQSTDTEDHANQTLFNIESLSMEIEEMDIITEIHTYQPRIIIDKENLPIMIDNGNYKERTICQSIKNIEFTCRNTMKNPDISDMELTCQMKKLPNNSIMKSVPTKITDKVITCQRTESDTLPDMEFICQLSNYTIKSVLNKTEMELTCQQLEKINESKIESSQTKFTYRSPNSTANSSLKSVPNKSEMELICQQNTNDKEHGIKLTESKLIGNRSEILEQQQTCLDNDDIEDMEWSPITPRKSTENCVQIDRIRKRSLVSNFIQFDSPQIKKQALSNGGNQTPKSPMNLSMKFITPDGKKKSNIPTPISSGKLKKQKITQPDENLDFLPIESTRTTTTKSSKNDNKKVLCSEKIDKNFEKYHLSYIKTPYRSDVTIMSPCIDNIQQLIDTTLTIRLPEPSISMNKTPSINKVGEIEITLPSTSYTELNIDDNINDTTASLKENCRFQNINNTFVLNNLCNHNDNDHVYIGDCSIELVSSFDDVKTTIDKSYTSDDYDLPLTRKFLENFQLKRYRFKLEPFPSTSNIEKNQKFIHDFIDNFEFKRFTAPSIEDVDRLMERLRNELDNNSENNTIIEISDSVNNESTLEKRIRTLEKEREEGIWELIETNNNLYKFNIVYSRLVLTVELNRDNENVSNFTIDIAKPEKIRNLLNYIHKAIKQKLHLSNMQSKLGQSYDLIVFLQYAEMVIEKCISFIKDFTLYGFYDPIFDEHCWLSFKIRDADKMKFFITSVNMLNLENLTDDDIKITFKFGDCDVKKLKKIVKKCSKRPRFLHVLINSIEEYCV